ncbi:MAG TPA: ABC transporter permease [Bryobacteraceae bacterium]|nr:ABC transporter permease [Bryobacteraceae bacterium]
MIADLLFRVRALFRRGAVEAEMEDELRFHRERQLAKLVNSGMSAAEARRRVQMDFGGLDQVREECRDARGARLIEIAAQDLRYGFRVLRKSPGFTVVALLTLAIGIGANTAIFSVLYGVLLRPLPYSDASRLIVMNETTPKVGLVSVSIPNFLDWRAQSHSFAGMAAVNDVGFNLSGLNGPPENVTGEAVSPNFLSLLGAHPFLGRDFYPAEEKPGAAPVVLLSYQLWQSHFGADRNVMGRTVTLDGRAFTIIGVLPPEFRWLQKVDVLEPIGTWAAGNSGYSERGERGDTVVIGRLAAGVSLARARAEMEGIASRLATAWPATNDQCGVALQPVRDVFVSGIRESLMVLFRAVTFVLLIACANVANLFLMRGVNRAREMTLRVAIGASRRRIVAQMLAESFILTIFGGLAGIALAAAAVQGIAALIPADVLAGATVELNGPAFLFTATVVILAAFLFGMLPALNATRTGAHAKLREGGRTSSMGGGQSRWRSALVMAEVSMALVLLVGAGLMMKSLYRLLSVDPGIRTERVVTMQLSLRTAQYDKNPAILNFWQGLLDRVRVLPGVQAVALASGVPLMDDHWRTDILIEGMALPKPGSFPHPDVHIVSPGYFDALGVRLLRGRVFTGTDNETSPRVALINARLAREYFGTADPVGRRFMFGHESSKQHPPRWVTIEGVVGDTKMYGLENPSRLEVYIPFRQLVTGSMRLVVKSAVDPAALVPAVRRAVASIDKDQPVFGVVTMQQVVRESVFARRITFIVLGWFSAIALLLAAIGIYGVISYSVAQRTQEIGIRMALGARPGAVLRLIMGEGAKLVGAGVVIGLVASLGLSRLIGSLLFSTSAADPGAFAAVTATLVLIAAVASAIPARRTLRVDPMATLRWE